MRDLILKIANWELKLIAKYTLLKHKPKIIGVTGSVGKTSTKNAIYAVLRKSGLRVRMAGGNLNNETGLPLAVIGDYKTSGGFWFLSGAIWKGFWELFHKRAGGRYPEVLILEYGADHPGDLDYLIGITRPDIAVVTAIGETPVHLEFYASSEEIAREKSKLVEAAPKKGAAVLNADDARVLSMARVAKCKVKSYGFAPQANLRIGSLKYLLVDNKPQGMSFTLETNSGKGMVSLSGILGKSHAYACAAGAAVGLMSGISLKEAASALALYKGEKGRGKIIEGKEGIVIIDESYNASPDSTRMALEALKELRARRKIAVLGDMLELGKQSEKAHRRIGALAAGVVDVLVTVGKDAKFIGEEAIRNGLDKKNIFRFEDSLDASQKLKGIVAPGDAVLIKGSQSIRAEKIVKGLMLRPAEAKGLLVRQYGKWLRS